MPDIHAIISDADRYNIVVTIVVRDPEGVRKARLIDRFGADIGSRDGDCTDTLIYVTDAIPRGRCPFQVEVTTCNSGMVTISNPYFSPEPGASSPMPCSPVMCEERSTCRDKQNELIRQRNLIISMCDLVSRYRSKIRELLTLMLTFYTIAFVLAATALAVAFIPYAGPIIAAGLAALAAVALGLAIFFNYHLNNVRKFLDEQLREMDEAKIRFTDIVDEIIANCCSGCIDVNLELPRCPSS